MKMPRIPAAVAFTVFALLVAGAGLAQSLPNPMMQEVLIKASLLTFNDANVTGNYSVLHAKLSTPFRNEVSQAKLKEVFKAFADKHVDFDIIAAKSPISTREAQINGNGALVLQGYFDTKPSRVTYDLSFIRSEGEWKLSDIDVRVKPTGE